MASHATTTGFGGADFFSGVSEIRNPKAIQIPCLMIFFRIEKANLGYPPSFDKPRIRRIMGGQGCQWGTSPGKNDQ